GAVPGCKKPKLACIDGEIRTMARLQKQFGCDHRAVFDTTYLVLTRALRRTVVNRPRLLLDKPYLYTEDALFASLYFRTLKSYKAGRPIPQAWQIALDTATKGEVNAGQDMLLGINAHVQNDMPFVLAELGLVMKNGKSRKPDHDAVNDVLAAAYQAVVDAITKRYDPLLATTNASWNPFEDIAALEMVRGWREEVWRNAERLISAKDKAARDQVAGQIQDQAAAWAQALAAPQQPGYRESRDAYCAAGPAGRPPKTVAKRHT
ncbi:MAG: hypothetical protein QOG68_1127, partial [Solirubrobacteraceae bacterium]|nr:hypothetical protein [Solirubrobacteraceae bacterium]